MTKRDLFWFVGGIVALLAVKYGVVGVLRWNNILHPGRVESSQWTVPN